MSRRVTLAAVTTLLTATAVAAPATGARASTLKAPKCFGKKPSVVVTARNKTVTLTKKNKNTVIDLLGKGDSVNAAKAKGFTYVCDLGGATKITTGDGNDKVQSSQGNPVIHLGKGNDLGELGKGNGVLYGDDGNDTLEIGKSGRQKAYGGAGRDVLSAGAATSTLDGQDGGTNYVVPTAYTTRTTVVLHPGDTVNGKNPNPPAPPPPAPTPVPTGTVAVTLGYGQTAAGNVPVGQAVVVKLTGAPASSHAVSHWTLDFGDGSPAHSGVGLPPPTVQHTWRTAGAYNVVLTLADEAGHTGTGTTTVTVASPPSTSISITSTSPSTSSQTSTSVTGTMTAAAASGATIVMSVLDFGDGSAPQKTNGAPAATFGHTYALGHYTVTLTAYDDHGGYDQATAKVNVVDSSTHILLTDRNGQNQPTSLLAEGSGYLDVSRTVGSTDGVLSALSVDPGDGTGAHDVLSAGHLNVYDYVGNKTYTVTVTAVSHSVTLTKTFTVYVAGTSSTSVTGPATPVTVAAGQPITFTAHHTLGAAPTAGGGPANSVVSEVVTFGDDSPDAPVSGALTATHVYATPGLYDVGDNLTDAYGGPNQFTLITVVVTGSAPQLKFNNNTPWLGTVVSATNSPATDADLTGFGSTGHVLGATWRVDWGDLSTPDTGTVNSSGYVDNPFLQHAYVAAGEYTVTASLTDGSGQVATVLEHVSVAAAPTVSIGSVTVSGQTVTVPVTATTGAGAIANTWQVSARDASYKTVTVGGNGVPPATVVVTLPFGMTATHVDASVTSDHDAASAGKDLS